MLQQYKNAIYNWVKSRVDSTVTIYWMEQSTPRPPRPCLSIKIVTPSIKPYRDDLRFDEATGRFTLVGPRIMMVSFNTYGEKAIDILIGLRDSVDDPYVVDQLESAGLAFQTDGEVENLTELLDSNFETRAHMDIIFGYHVENLIKVVEIDKISINGTDVPAP